MEIDSEKPIFGRSDFRGGKKKLKPLKITMSRIWTFMLKKWSSTLKNGPFYIITGDTGCGKSTRIFDAITLFCTEKRHKRDAENTSCLGSDFCKKRYKDAWLIGV